MVCLSYTNTWLERKSDRPLTYSQALKYLVDQWSIQIWISLIYWLWEANSKGKLHRDKCPKKNSEKPGGFSREQMMPVHQEIAGGDVFPCHSWIDSCQIMGRFWILPFLSSFFLFYRTRKDFIKRIKHPRARTL